MDVAVEIIRHMGEDETVTVVTHPVLAVAKAVAEVCLSNHKAIMDY